MISGSEALSIEIIVIWFLEEVSLIDRIPEVKMFVVLVLDPKLSFLVLMVNSILLLLRLSLRLHLPTFFLLFPHDLLNLADDAFWCRPFQRFQFGEDLSPVEIDIKRSNLRKVHELIVIIPVVNIGRTIG